MLKKSFEQWYLELGDENHLEFDRIENKRSPRPDLHAFLLLDELFPHDRDMVAGAEHDIIYLDFNEDVEITEEQAIELIRCGVMASEGSLAIFV